MVIVHVCSSGKSQGIFKTGLSGKHALPPPPPPPPPPPFPFFSTFYSCLLPLPSPPPTIPFSSTSSPILLIILLLSLPFLSSPSSPYSSYFFSSFIFPFTLNLHIQTLSYPTPLIDICLTRLTTWANLYQNLGQQVTFFVIVISQVKQTERSLRKCPNTCLQENVKWTRSREDSLGLFAFTMQMYEHHVHVTKLM